MVNYFLFQGPSRYLKKKIQFHFYIGYLSIKENKQTKQRNIYCTFYFIFMEKLLCYWLIWHVGPIMFPIYGLLFCSIACFEWRTFKFEWSTRFFASGILGQNNISCVLSLKYLLLVVYKGQTEFLPVFPLVFYTSSSSRSQILRVPRRWHIISWNVACRVNAGKSIIFNSWRK